MKTLISNLMETATVATYTPAVEVVNQINDDFLFAGKAVFTVEPAAKYVAANSCRRSGSWRRG
jgi:hypothetical protein